MSALEARAAQHRTSARLELHQERRRKEALQRQKDARSDRTNRFRALEPEPIVEDQQLTKAQRKKQRAFDDARQRAERWSGELCSYDWLCDIPVNLNGTNTSEGWFCLPRPEGRRVVLVAAKGKVVSRQTSGDKLHEFSCDCLPGGSVRTKHKPQTILDCVFVEHSSTYIITDCMCWAGYDLYTCAAEFRFYLCGNQPACRVPAMTRPCWPRRAMRNRHRHAIEQASRRWRGGRRGDSGQTRRKFDFHTGLGSSGGPRGRSSG